MRLQGKTAVVTGGGTGIGWGIARALARKAARCDRRAPSRQTPPGRRQWDRQPAIVWQAVDVADRTQGAEPFAVGAARAGSAGYPGQLGRRQHRQSRDGRDAARQWDQILAINATGAYNCLYDALPPCEREERAHNQCVVRRRQKAAALEASPIAPPSSP